MPGRHGTEASRSGLLLGAILGSLLTSLFFYVIGYSTTGWQMYWLNGTYVQIGLWDACHCGLQPEYWQDWFLATRVLTTFALVFLCVATAMFGLYCLLAAFRTKHVLIAAVVASFLAVLFAFISLLVFGVNSAGSHLHYSYAFVVMATLACVTAALGGIVFVRRTDH